MKTKFTKKGRRILSAALCLLMMITALPMSAFAWTSEEGKSCTSSFGDYYVGSDGEYYRSKATYSFIVYDSKGNITVQSINAGNAKRKYLMTDNSGTHQVYCVESGVDFNTGNSYVSKSGKNSSYFQNLPTDAQFGIMMALMYGWHEGKSSPVAGTNVDDYAFARTNVVRTVRTSVPCAENVCMRTSATSNVLPSTEFGYPNSLVRGQPLIPRSRKRGAAKCENEMCRYFSA